jgi:PAS domain S-box-containing protein
VKFIIEETIPYYDGVTRILETARSPLVQNGVIAGLIVIARDITERKMAEHELQLQTTVLTTLFDSIPDVIFTLDTSLRFTQCNKSFLEHFGLSKEDIINKGEDGLGISAELTEEHNDWNRRVINEGRKFVFEERIPAANGTNPLYETVKAPLVLDGKIIGLLGIAHDITQHKEMEEAALAASRSKSAFLANMSHEIRTPMNSIIGFSELALDGEVSSKTREYLAKIHTNAEWLLQIINDILDISKIESGKMELEKIPFDMHELFENCRTLIIPKAVEKGINLHFYAEPSVGKSPLGDPTRLRQILVNLLSNAVKFTNSGTVKVLTDIKGKDEKTVTFHFEIKDSGIGMTGEQIKKIFEPFIQAETGTTRKYGGTGLGLAISKNFIELMGGRLAVESTPGVGSKFSFDLTFDTIDTDSGGIFGRKAVLDDIEKPAFDGEIMLCEDNVMNQQVICEHLARVGLKTIVAENGKIGVEMVQRRKEKGEKQFDLIFMDIHMPVMDGLEAAAKIIALGTGVPLIAMTANIMASDREVYKTSGMEDCIGKPFTSQELWRCLLKYLTPVTQKNGNKNAHRKNTQIEDDLKFQKDLKLLFARTNQAKYEEIEKALKDEDIKLANRLAHSLKTNAGHIGKPLLRQAADEVEQALRDGKNLVTHGQMKKLEIELKKALEELQPLVEEAEAQAEQRKASVLEPEKVRELFEKLEPLLKTGNPESLDYIADLRAVAGSELLIQQIEDFDFGPAVFTFAELKKKL